MENDDNFFLFNKDKQDSHKESIKAKTFKEKFGIEISFLKNNPKIEFSMNSSKVNICLGLTS